MSSTSDIYNNVPVAYLKIDNDGFINDSNIMASSLFHLDRVELLGMNFNDLFPEAREGEDVGLRILGEIQRGENVLYQEVKMVNSYGKILWIRYTLKPYFDSGELIGGHFFAEDISAHKYSAEALKESEKKYRLLLDSSSDGIFVIFNNKYQYVNPEFERISASKSYDLLEKIFTIVFHPDDSGKLLDASEKILNQGEDNTLYEIRVINKKAEIKWAEVLFKPINWENKDSVMVIVSDITERKELERAMLNTIIETEEKERHRFSVDLHDGLGPLLSSIKIYMELIQTANDDSSRKEYTDYTKGLIDQAILSAKEIANNLTPNVLNDFGLIVAIESFCEKINKTDTINVSFYNSKITNVLDKKINVTIYRVVTELVNNTIKHASANNIYINIINEHNLLTLIYVDDGIGFDTDKVMKNNKESLGIKSIMSRIQSVNGSYKLYSAVGAGFRVRIDIDLLKSE